MGCADRKCAEWVIKVHHFTTDGQWGLFPLVLANCQRLNFLPITLSVHVCCSVSRSIILYCIAGREGEDVA